MEIIRLAYVTKPKQRLLWAGSGIGRMARFAAWMFEASELHMVDYAVPPERFNIFCWEKFHKLDVTTDKFVNTLTGDVDMVVCVLSVHEFSDATAGVTNLLRVLPKTGEETAWFVDMTGYRWQELQQPGAVDSIPEEHRDHVIKDLENVKRLGLDDQERVFALYETAGKATNHNIISKRVLTGEGRILAHDLYEVLFGNPG